MQACRIAHRPATGNRKAREIEGKLEVAESRHGYVAHARASGEVPEWLARVVAKGG